MANMKYILWNLDLTKMESLNIKMYNSSVSN